MQVILRLEITIESYAHESIFWFIPKHSIKIYTECSGYDEVCMKVVSWSTKNRSLLIRGDHILCILITRWLKKIFWPKLRWRLERVSNTSSLKLSLNEYVFEFDIIPYLWTYSGCRDDRRIELHGNLPLKDISDIFIKFYF